MGFCGSCDTVLSEKGDDEAGSLRFLVWREDKGTSVFSLLPSSSCCRVVVMVVIVLLGEWSFLEIKTVVLEIARTTVSPSSWCICAQELEDVCKDE